MRSPPHAACTARKAAAAEEVAVAVAVAEAAAPPRAVDLGCGKGRDAVYLASRGWSVLVVDRQRASSSRLGAVPELPYRSVLAVDNQRAFLDHVQARCSRDAAEMRPRCG